MKETAKAETPTRSTSDCAPSRKVRIRCSAKNSSARLWREGNTNCSRGSGGRGSDHPRVGGEHLRARTTAWPKYGSSPRGRGTRCSSRWRPVFQWIIPAWAGNPKDCRVTVWWVPDHPRVGGEHFPPFPGFHLHVGSSPRGRGTLPHPENPDGVIRIIPAWAGNTTTSAPPKSTTTDHPRVGGEHLAAPRTLATEYGSSPRGRGTRSPEHSEPTERRIIPAWAGNTHPFSSLWRRVSDHPRVGGEHSSVLKPVATSVGSSPRGRGTRFCSGDQRGPIRIIPAWAGNTSDRPPRLRIQPDHPRVGGEHD